jgi:hypothetical protein
MKPVLERVRDQYSPELAFLPISRMVYAYRHGGVNGFCRYLDSNLMDKSFQYTAAPEDAAEWMAILRAKWVVPYATFTFPRWSTPIEVGEFAAALRARRLGQVLYPMRPLDRIDPEDLRGRWFAAARRSALVAWFRIGGAISRLDRGLYANVGYRYLRKALRQLVLRRA